MKNSIELSWDKVYSLFKALRSSTTLNLEAIRRRYIDESNNFEETKDLLKELGIIEIKNKQIIIHEELTSEILSSEQKLKLYFVKIFLSKGNILKLYDTFFNGFIPYYSSYIYKPAIQERLKFSEIRNFLIDLELLEYYIQLRGYIPKGMLVEYLGNWNRSYSYKQFTKDNKEQEELGLQAELLVYKKEREAFNNDPINQNKIRHVSIENVMAGYDIESIVKHSNGDIFSIFIEVKAVSSIDHQFYWSRNEIEKAKSLGDSYFLYLLPISEKNVVDIKTLIKIKNPYINIFDNKSWDKICELMSFSKR